MPPRDDMSLMIPPVAQRSIVRTNECTAPYVPLLTVHMDDYNSYIRTCGWSCSCILVHTTVRSFSGRDSGIEFTRIEILRICLE